MLASRTPLPIVLLIVLSTVPAPPRPAAATEADDVSVVGTRLPSAELPPGWPGPQHLPAGTLQAAVTAFQSDDLSLARRELEVLLARRKVSHSDRVRAQFLLGWISARLGNHQQASASFYRVRKLDEHPLREMAMYLEAEADRRRGHGRTAIEECDRYHEEFPAGRFADECRLTQAHAFADIGKLGAAADRFQAFLDDNPDDQRAEAVSLRLASAYEALGRREAAANRYRRLFIHHRLPSTGKVAQEGMERLAAAGEELPPLQDMELYTRACSLRRTGEFQASYDLFCELDERHDASGDGATALGKRLEDERHEFLWRNRRYLEVGRWNGHRYDEEPDHPDAAQHLHWAVQGYSRSGRFMEAVKYQEYGLKRFPKHPRFRGKEERTALLYIAAGEYAKARTSYQAWQKRSGRAKRSSKVRFYVAYCAYRAGDNETAIAEFTQFVKSRTSYRTAAYWYRSKAYDALGKKKEARADRRTVVERDPDDWYALLVQDRKRRKRRGDAALRDGRWPGPPPRAIPPPPTPAPPTSEALVRLLGGIDREPDAAEPTILTREVHAARRDADGRPAEGRATLSWPVGVTPAETFVAPAAEPAPAAVATPFDPSAIPTTWRPSPYWNEAKGAALWKQFAETNAHLWDDLPRAYELSLIGLGEQAGAVLADVFAEAKKVRRSKKIRRRVERWKAAEKKRLAAEAKKAAAAKKKKAAAAKKKGAEAEKKNAAGAEGEAKEDKAAAKKKPPAKEARWAAILDLNVKNKDWMAIFAAAGSPPGVSDFAVNSIPYAKLPRSMGPEIAASWTMTYPAAYAPHVWKHSRANDVDPLLMLSIMRAESLFRHDAVSRAGALGLVQVMPATGSRVAALAGMNDFRVERLLDPAVNIELGTFYLGRLLERYDGQFALAVGSYNGGPHNVGRWLRGKVGMPYDEFVEEIAFDETRGYIKKVTEFYAIYLDLYGDGAVPEIPLKTTADDPAVIDF